MSDFADVAQFVLAIAAIGTLVWSLSKSVFDHRVARAERYREVLARWLEECFNTLAEGFEQADKTIRSTEMQRQAEARVNPEFIEEQKKRFDQVLVANEQFRRSRARLLQTAAQTRMLVPNAEIVRRIDSITAAVGAFDFVDQADRDDWACETESLDGWMRWQFRASAVRDSTHRRLSAFVDICRHELFHDLDTWPPAIE